MATVPNDLRERLRRKIKDYAELNRLLAEKENIAEDLDTALEDAVEAFNTAISPVTNYSLANFPSRGILIMFAVIELLISNSILATRNRVVYSDGKIGGIDDQLKAGGFAELAVRLQSIYYPKAEGLKTSLQLETIGDSVSSDYAGLDEDQEEY